MRTSARFASITVAVALLLATRAHAQQDLELVIDADDNPSTGCTVSLPGGGQFTGVEEIVTTTADRGTGEVTAVQSQLCVTPPSAFSASTTVAPPPSPWPIGISNGLDGTDVVESFVPFTPGQAVVRLAVISSGDALTTRQPAGNEAILLQIASIPTIPTLAQWVLLLLALLLGGLALYQLRRDRRLAFLVCLLVALGASAAWAVFITLDGNTDDWAPADKLADDNLGDAGSPDLRALFARFEAGKLYFRIDAVLAMPQSITFTSTPPASATVGGPTYNVTATATSGLPVTLAIDASAAGVCSLAGSTVSFVGAGTCVIDANQGGDATWAAAPQVQQSFAVGNAVTTLATSVNDLALSVTGLTEYGVIGTPSSGVSRVITVTNTGSSLAINLAVNLPTWPIGTTSATSCGTTLAAGGSCTITITPGSTATSDGTTPCSIGTAPVPGVVQVTADNASAVSSNVAILDYGCVYQGGYVYALDDTTPNTGRVGGKVAATADQAAPYPNGVVWSSNGGGAVALDAIYGISEISTTSAPDPSGGQVSGQAACDGATDGSCNTNNVYVYYQNFAIGAPINLSLYAAGLCRSTISGYSDWYLPSICELGYGAQCGSPSTPTLQNMQSSLVDFGGFTSLAGSYWSSTELSVVPQNGAWGELFASGGGSSQGSYPKDDQFGVRCSRALSP